MTHVVAVNLGNAYPAGAATLDAGAPTMPGLGDRARPLPAESYRSSERAITRRCTWLVPS